MDEEAVLLTVRYFDHASLEDLAAALDAEVGPVFRTCRQLDRAGLLEKVRPMTFRITAEGVEHLDDRESSSDRADWNPFGGGDGATGGETDLDPPDDPSEVTGSGPVASPWGWSSRDDDPDS